MLCLCSEIIRLDHHNMLQVRGSFAGQQTSLLLEERRAATLRQSSVHIVTASVDSTLFYLSTRTETHKQTNTCPGVFVVPPFEAKSSFWAVSTKENECQWIKRMSYNSASRMPKTYLWTFSIAIAALATFLYQPNMSLCTRFPRAFNKFTVVTKTRFFPPASS